MNNEGTHHSCDSKDKEMQLELTGKKTSSCCAPPATRGESLSQESSSPNQNPIALPATLPEQRPTVSLPSATFLMGTDYDRGFPADGEGPVRPVLLSSFEIDTFPVTNSDFATFIAATNYRTEAELFGWSFVFWAHIPEEKFEALVEDTVALAPWWCKVPGATWNCPEGPGSTVQDRPTHPVVHVSWNDAATYAAWASKSLPTEAQWEYAARGSLEQKLYPWGDELTPEGKTPLQHLAGGVPSQQHRRRRLHGKLPRRQLSTQW